MIYIPRLSDLHVHFRQEPLLGQVAPMTDRYAAYALAMPNLLPPICTPKGVTSYRGRLSNALKLCKPLLTFKLLSHFVSDDVKRLVSSGVVAGKLYPEGVTTHSHDGITTDMLMHPDKYQQFQDVLKEMEQHSIILCLHGELPGASCLQAEQEFLFFVKWVLKTYPNLRVVLEHITTEAAVQFVLDNPRLHATITAHHLFLTIDDILNDGGKLNPHNYCKPVAKTRADRQALQFVVLRGCSQFFLGSDSAPHPRNHKECAACCAGVLTAPILPELLLEFFAKSGHLDRVVDFTSTFGNKFYGLKACTDSIAFKDGKWRVPLSYGELVPFYAEKCLHMEMC